MNISKVRLYSSGSRKSGSNTTAENKYIWESLLDWSPRSVAHFLTAIRAITYTLQCTFHRETGRNLSFEIFLLCFQRLQKGGFVTGNDPLLLKLINVVELKRAEMLKLN